MALSINSTVSSLAGLLSRRSAMLYPLPIQIDITNACNLNCSHCYHSHHSNQGAMGIDQWFDVLDQYSELLSELNRTPELVVCGGEPFFSPDLFPLIDRFRSLFPQAPVKILTNGTLILKRHLSKLSPNVEIQISIDGIDQQSHDLVRGNGSYKRTKETVELLRHNGIPVTLLSILSKRTSDQISEFFERAKSWDVSSQNFIRLVEQGNALELVSQNLDRPLMPLEIKKAYYKILQNSLKYQVSTNTQQPLFALISKRLGAIPSFGFGALVIDYKGYLKVSSRVDYKVGSVIDSGLRSLYLRSKVFKDLRKNRIDTCKDCSLVSICGGDRNAAFATFGSFTARDPGCWKYID